MGLRLQSQRPHDIVSIAEKLKAGSVAIRVGFWLDNEVVVFSELVSFSVTPAEGGASGFVIAVAVR